MEIKTCEEYVLSELDRWQKKAEETEKQRIDLLNSARAEIAQRDGVIKYSDKVIKTLAGYVTLKKDEHEDGKWLIAPTGLHTSFSVDNPGGLELFIKLAPIIGDADAKATVQALYAMKGADTGDSANPESGEKTAKSKKKVQNTRKNNNDNKED